MGRSRANFQTDEDPIQRTRRKKNLSSGDNIESTSAGQGTSEGKKALYHCNYCNKDISGKIRIKCAECPDFDLCIECMSVGAEVQPHKSNHAYRVMDNLSFPLICPDWNADDEMLLLEGLEMYGLGNWAEVGEHVGTKTKEQCIEHYANIYTNSPHFPLPDMSHVVGKNRKELLAMAKGLGEDKKGVPMIGDFNIKEESPFSPTRVKLEELHKGDPSGRLLSGVNADLQTDRNFGGNNKPISSGNEGPSLVESSGFNPKRREFDPEYDNDAEQLLADMEFKENDTEEERELKLRVLRIYSKRLDERKHRKEFILERNLLYQSPLEKDMSPEERAICRRYDAFMRFHSKDEHDDLLQTVIAEHRFSKRIKHLKEARAIGCRSASEADRYIGQERKRDFEERGAKENALIGPNGHGGPNSYMVLDSAGKDSSSRVSGQTSSTYINDLDITGFLEAQLLSEAEKRLCYDMKLPPSVYLKMQQVMSEEIFKGNVGKKADAHLLFKIEPIKIDRVYDMLVKKGIAQS